MYLESLELKNFRNYEEESFKFGSGLNLLVGSNAQGKTNCVEAVFFLCTGFSPRASMERQLIRYGEESACIKGISVSDFGWTSVEIELCKNKKKTIRVNGAPVLKVGELFGNINSVFFNPDELKLIKEAPGDRRRFMDLALSQMYKSYFYSLVRYNKILAQRNNLLKEESEEVVLQTLPVWDRQLCENASKIIFRRNEFIKVLSPFAKEAHFYLTGGAEDLDITAEYRYEGSENEIAAQLYEALKESLDKDMRLKFTNVGPHRDDLKIKINGEDVKTYGSQGQKRTAALSIKLAETEILKAHSGEYPILILDDVLSELDRERQKKLLKRIEGIQTLLTCTDVSSEIFEGTDYNEIKIEGGKAV